MFAGGQPQPATADPFAGGHRPANTDPFGQPPTADPHVGAQPQPTADAFAKAPHGPGDAHDQQLTMLPPMTGSQTVPDLAFSPGAGTNTIGAPAGAPAAYAGPHAAALQAGLHAPQPSADELFPSGAEEGEKSFTVTWLLAWLAGVVGADRFYLGKTGTAVAKLVTAGGLGVWALYDLFLTLLGHQTAKDGSLLAGYDERRRLAWIVTLGVWFVAAAVYVAVVVLGVF